MTAEDYQTLTQKLAKITGQNPDSPEDKSGFEVVQGIEFIRQIC